MTAREFFERAAGLERARTPFALATVVKRDGPISSHLGDRAIVFADGRMQGFVGGACSRDVVRRQALDAMRSGSARLVQIEKTCASEGAVEVYVEPHLPARVVIVAGATPVAVELARLAAMLDGYRVTRVIEQSELAEFADGEGQTIVLDALTDFLAGLDAEDRARVVAVVATQGHYDDAALALLLKDGDPVYAGLLASRKRAAEVFAAVEERGVPRERIARVHNPAGLDIGARRPGEVAISILAEIVATLAASEAAATAGDSKPDEHSCCHGEAAS